MAASSVLRMRVQGPPTAHFACLALLPSAGKVKKVKSQGGVEDGTCGHRGRRQSPTHERDRGFYSLFSVVHATHAPKITDAPSVTGQGLGAERGRAWTKITRPAHGNGRRGPQTPWSPDQCCSHEPWLPLHGGAQLPGDTMSVEVLKCPARPPAAAQPDPPRCRPTTRHFRAPGSCSSLMPRTVCPWARGWRGERWPSSPGEAPSSCLPTQAGTGAEATPHPAGNFPAGNFPPGAPPGPERGREKCL